MTDADRNRLICEGLGIPHISNQVDPVNGLPYWIPIYPDLATREGQGLLEKALLRHGAAFTIAHRFSGCTVCLSKGDESVYGIEPDAWAALFEAAWALRERENPNA
jgi:hypothetical protein